MLHCRNLEYSGISCLCVVAIFMFIPLCLYFSFKYITCCMTLLVTVKVDVDYVSYFLSIVAGL